MFVVCVRCNMRMKFDDNVKDKKYDEWCLFFLARYNPRVTYRVEFTSRKHLNELSMSSYFLAKAHQNLTTFGNVKVFPSKSTPESYHFWHVKIWKKNILTLPP